MAVVRRLVLSVLVWLVVVAPLSAMPGSPPTEYELKATFLYNFAKYVTWPVSGTGGSIRVCVLGQDPFGHVLDETVAGETVQGRPLLVQRLSRAEAIRECQLVWVSPSEAATLPRILDLASRAEILTVSDMDDFARRGGIIGLRNEASRIQLEINEKAAERAGLKLSSQLLKLARIVDSGKP